MAPMNAGSRHRQRQKQKRGASVADSGDEELVIASSGSFDI
jgi:hypothetical protein